MSFLFRRPGALIALGSSALGGAAYQFASPPPSSGPSLDPHAFTPYTLEDKQAVSKTNAIFTLRNRDGSPELESVKEAWKNRVWSVEIKQPQLQIARAYTPLPPISEKKDDKEPQELRLLIRQEEGGEVSTYLHRLPEQSTIELRGPGIGCELPDDIREVIFLAGGTGIAPAMQVAHALGSRPSTKVQILWANRKREECLGGISDGEVSSAPQQTSGWKSMFGFGAPAPQAPILERRKQEKGVIVRELDGLKKRSATQSSELAIQYYVDEENRFIKPDQVAKRLQGAPEENASKVIFISGPDGFIEFWAGKKLWIGGKEVQGPLGGVLGRMDLKGWSVYKL